MGQRDLKSELRLQFGPKEITNRGMDFKLGQGLRIGAEHSTTVFEYSESEYCFNSKVGLWIFTIQRLPKVTRASLYLPLNGAKLCYTFLSHDLRKSKKCNKVSCMPLLAVSPKLGEFSNYTGPLFKPTKKIV